MNNLSDSDLPFFWTIIPAAGNGLRMCMDSPKQYMNIAGKTVLERTIECFIDHIMLKGIVVCIAKNDKYWKNLSYSSHKSITSTKGGPKRAHSVLNGVLSLFELGAHNNDWIIVHDAVRPNLYRSDLDKLLRQLKNDSVGGLLAIPAFNNTIKRANNDFRVIETIDRSMIWLAYTPQMFRLGMLYKALVDALKLGITITDEASAMEFAGYYPKLIECNIENLKITTLEDVIYLQTLLR